MPESFDKQLSNKIRSTFENYNEPFNNDAWKLMQQKLENKNKKYFVLLINIAKAASIILFVGISVLWPYNTNHQLLNSNKSTLIKHSILKNKNTKFKNNELLITEDHKLVPSTGQIKQKKIITNKPIKYTNLAESEQNVITYESVEDSNKIEEKQIFADLLKPLDRDTINNELIVDSVTDKYPVLIPDDDNFFKERKSDKKIRFGIAVSSHYSTSEIGATDRINIGGGFYTGYVISEKISINSGILLANHNMNTKKRVQTENNVYNSSNTTLTETSDTHVLLVGLDIPLNIQLNLNKMYISTGISSLFYLKETYSEDFYVENSTTVYNFDTEDYNDIYYYETKNQTENKGAFQTFDFAKLFNLSVGYKIPLKKGDLILEPYAKIPIGNLTSYHISYGYGGLSLKYDF